MKEVLIKGSVSLAFAALAASFRALAAPLILLMAVMLIDYVTGMARAWITRSFSSRTGLRGIVKKLLYPVLVAVGMTADYLAGDALARAGVSLPLTGVVGLTVTLWLIINELISILENLAGCGVPVPDFLVKLMARLKDSSEGEKK
ncbi:MAG: phage holin family protein [Clostridia bacterium]|nr:phage holin family protein [Clostridia bacterium]